MEMWINEGWLLFTAVIFTGLGWWFGVQENTKDVATVLLDKLIDDGYIRTRTLENGDIELVKLDEKEEQC